MAYNQTFTVRQKTAKAAKHSYDEVWFATFKLVFVELGKEGKLCFQRFGKVAISNQLC